MASTAPSSAASGYAQALLELADERQQTTQIAEELRSIRQIVDQNPVFKLYLSDPGVGQDQRRKSLDAIFAGKVNDLILNFLHVLNQRSQLGRLPEICQAYDDLLDERLGKIEVDVTVAEKLSPEQLETVRKQVGAALKRDAVVHQYLDASLIGGMVLRVQDQLIDASVKTQLENLRRRLRDARHL
jgi:F-type H+-transporting ATPase subunit delta